MFYGYSSMISGVFVLLLICLLSYRLSNGQPGLIHSEIWSHHLSGLPLHLPPPKPNPHAFQGKHTAVNVTKDTPLYFLPERAGLFSVFLQLKVAYRLARSLGRQMLVEPTSSQHYGWKPLDLCGWFILPADIHCANASEAWQFPCQKHGQAARNYSHPAGPLCFDIHSYVAYINSTVRVTLIKAVSQPPRMQLSNQHTELARAYQQALGITDHSNYTVVHWRRGDQLKTRCLNFKDISVNCASAAELMALVQPLTADPLIYIATNEPQNSTASNYLGEHGFKLFSSVSFAVGVFEVFAIETLLMVMATSFLAWGVSEVNDVVEYERMMTGRSFCLHQDKQRVNGSYGLLTWCEHYHHQSKHRNYDNSTVKIT